ncbi:MAG: lipopolysaccharide biosynthesis protein [Clostridia bacterium]|nr:lipopolysaccharide biosynthesis protein [Clostridia bacterium]
MVNILFCGNEGVFDGVLTAALSILMRTPPGEPFTFYLFTMDLTRLDPRYTPIPPRAVSFLERVVKQFDARSAVVPVDVTGLYEREFGGCPNEGAYCSPYTLIRLFADIVPQIPDKLLYLDADVMFNRDAHLLYDIDVSGVEYAAARDHYGKYLIHPNYINAGVLLFNMKKARETGLFGKARALIKTKKLVFADQSALIRSTTSRKVLPQRFNDQKFLHRHTVVRHFSKRLFYLPYPHTENVKQWQVEKVHSLFGYTAFDDVYEKYLALRAAYQSEE